MADEKKKKLQNIAKGKHSSRIRAVSHPKGEYLKFGGFDRKEVYTSQTVDVPAGRGTLTHNVTDARMTPRAWLGHITTARANPSKTLGQKAFLFGDKVYKISGADASETKV